MIGLSTTIFKSAGKKLVNLFGSLASRSTYVENVQDSLSEKNHIDDLGVLDKASILLTPTATSDARVHSVKTYTGDELVANGNFEELGNEEVTNGDYSDAGVGNAISQSNGVLVNENNQLKITSAGGGYARAVWATGGSAGDTFVVEADIISISGSVRFYDQSNNGTYADLVAGSTYKRYIVLGSDAKNLGFGGNNDVNFELVLDNISVKQVDPNDRWTFNTGWSTDGTKAIFNDTVSSALYQNINLISGKNYNIKFNVSDISSGAASIWIGNSAGGVNYFGGTYAPYANGSYDLNFTMPSTQSTLAFYGNQSGSSFSIDNISLKDVSSDFDFDRASSATRINSDGLVQDMQSITDPELVLNGDFDADLSGWTNSNSHWQWTSQGAYYPLTTSHNPLSQTITNNLNDFLEFTFTLDIVQGTANVYYKNSSDATVSAQYTTSGTYTIYTVPVKENTNINFSRYGGVNTEFYLDNVSVVEQTPDTTPKTISIDGTIQGWQFNAPGDYLKLNNINRWGALDIHNIAMFFRCANMTCTATDAPTVSTTSFYRMFRGCSNFNGPIGNWDVSGATRIDECFKGCSTFNQPLNSWDVSNINVFAQAFNSCGNFVQDLNDWQINNSEIVNMYAMFYNCFNFNGDIYSWDTSKVWNMALMFYNCQRFDQSLAAWNVESVTNFGDVNLGFMRLAAGLSTSNYNLTLVSWAHQNVNIGLEVDFGGSQYSAGGAAAASRNILTSAPNNWIISDGGSV